MDFSIKPTIALYDALQAFMEVKGLGTGDLIVTNEYVLAPALGEKSAPCDTLYQEKYGQGEPTDEMVDAILTDIKGKGYKRIIAIGGGTIIDVSKLLLFNDEYKVEDLYAKGAELKRERELIVIPTTCGTGSEVTNISILEFKQKKTKMGLAIPQLFADEAALVPAMLKTLPYGVFATSSIDALVHAMESYVSPKATPFSRVFGKGAMEKILGGYLKMQASGEARLPEDMEDFLVASTMAGVAFGNAGCAAVHALAYPIGAMYHVPHGKANHMVFEATFNMYKELGADLGPAEEVLAEILDCEKSQVWEKMFALLDFVLKRESLGSIGVDESIAEEMAASVIANQQRLLANNPLELSQEQVKTIYVRCI